MPVEKYKQMATKQLKYRNVKTQHTTENGKIVTFDSKREKARYDELMLMYRNCDIADLRLQPQFTLQEAYTTPNGERIRAIRYQADFAYIVDGPKCIVEDVKTKATRTPEYQLKKKLMADRLGILVVEI